MQLRLLAAGTRLPTWVNEGFDDYARRMPRSLALVLTEIPVAKRSATRSVAQCLREESSQFSKRLDARCNVVALDVEGREFSTEALGKQLARWREDGRDTALLIGGPDGLHADLKQRASVRWSLSRLTMPHALVRVVVAEQLYRAWTVIEGHPYHRGDN